MLQPHGTEFCKKQMINDIDPLKYSESNTSMLTLDAILVSPDQLLKTENAHSLSHYLVIY